MCAPEGARNGCDCYLPATHLRRSCTTRRNSSVSILCRGRMLRRIPACSKLARAAPMATTTTWCERRVAQGFARTLRGCAAQRQPAPATATRPPPDLLVVDRQPWDLVVNRQSWESHHPALCQLAETHRSSRRAQRGQAWRRSANQSVKAQSRSGHSSTREACSARSRGATAQMEGKTHEGRASSASASASQANPMLLAATQEAVILGAWPALGCAVGGRAS